MALPNQKEQAIAGAHLQQAFAEYVKNPCTEKIDLLEYAIFIYDGVAAGLTLRSAISEYEDYVYEGGNMSQQMNDAGILCGEMEEGDHPITDSVNTRTQSLLDSLKRE